MWNENNGATVLSRNSVETKLSETEWISINLSHFSSFSDYLHVHVPSLQSFSPNVSASYEFNVRCLSFHGVLGSCKQSVERKWNAGGIVYTLAPRPKTFAGWLTFSSQFPVRDNPSEIFILFSLSRCSRCLGSASLADNATLSGNRAKSPWLIAMSAGAAKSSSQKRKQKQNGKVPRDVLSSRRIML